jgi:hypothetical protein
MLNIEEEARSIYSGVLEIKGSLNFGKLTNVAAITRHVSLSELMKTRMRPDVQD